LGLGDEAGESLVREIACPHLIVMVVHIEIHRGPPRLPLGVRGIETNRTGTLRLRRARDCIPSPPDALLDIRSKRFLESWRSVGIAIRHQEKVGWIIIHHVDAHLEPLARRPNDVSAFGVTNQHAVGEQCWQCAEGQSCIHVPMALTSFRVSAVSPMSTLGIRQAAALINPFNLALFNEAEHVREYETLMGSIVAAEFDVTQREIVESANAQIEYPGGFACGEQPEFRRDRRLEG